MAKDGSLGEEVRGSRYTVHTVHSTQYKVGQRKRSEEEVRGRGQRKRSEEVGTQYTVQSKSEEEVRGRGWGRGQRK